MRELIGERARLLGRNIEAEDLHCNQSVTLGIVGAENRTEGANTNLMQDPKWTELGRCGEGRGIVSCQGTPQGVEKM